MFGETAITFSGASSWTAWPHWGRTCSWNFPVDKQSDCGYMWGGSVLLYDNQNNGGKRRNGKSAENVDLCFLPCICPIVRSLSSLSTPVQWIKSGVKLCSEWQNCLEEEWFVFIQTSVAAMKLHLNCQPNTFVPANNLGRNRERSHLRAEAVLARGRWEREQTGLWTSHPSIFPYLTALLARWKYFPFLSVWKESTL